ncbi:MAG: NAD(+)/NADH kinase [Cyanobacteria bacterium SZAS TMP-1]|nr:NAD(+)/NADH kinase [Cyanobacteria bacterium SZAS TMP-1]
MNNSAIPAVIPPMPPRTIKRAVIVVKETYLDQVRAAGDKHLLAEIAAGAPGLESVQESHRQHERCIVLVTEALTAHGIKIDTIHRNSEGLKEKLQDCFSEIDLVVTVGGDGTFLRASHELGSDVAVVGVNSAPITSFGHYCCCDGPGFAAVLQRILDGSFQPSRLLRLNLAIDGVDIAEPVLNEVLVAHKHPAGTSRYHLTVAGQVIQHKCSGLLIAAPAGSTGFLRSEGGIVLPITARQFTFVERAPFLKIGETPAMKSGVVDAGDKISIVSQMQDGKLFIDGDHIEYDFPRGATLTVTASDDDLLAYINPDCHAPYLSATGAETGLKRAVRNALRRLRQIL